MGAYELYGLSGAWKPNRNLKFTVGVKNLLDRDPPFSNQAYYFLATYDPTYADPRGRYYWGAVTYTFR